MPSDVERLTQLRDLLIHKYGEHPKSALVHRLDDIIVNADNTGTDSSLEDLTVPDYPLTAPADPYAGVPGIAFIGAIGSGKSTMCNELIDRDLHMARFKKISFADPLKHEVAIALAETNRDFIHDAKDWEATLRDPQRKLPYRGLLQWWGTDYRRAQNPDYWVEKWHSATHVAANHNQIVLVDDCRFPNEYALLRDMGYVIVLLHSEHGSVSDDAVAVSHESEAHWPTFWYNLSLAWIPVSERVQALEDYLFQWSKLR